MKIHIIATGGTIGSETTETGINTRNTNEKIIDEVLLEEPIGSNLPVHEFRVTYPMNLLSEDMIPNDWLSIAKAIREAIADKADAVVVTHGTDTMAYTMAATAFILSPLPVPVIFTGALKTFDEENSDAPANLWDSIIFAEHQVKNRANGVYLVFQGPRKCGEAYWGPRVQSIKHGGRFFHTIDNNRIAYIQKGKVEDYRFYFGRKKNSHYQSSQQGARFSDNIEVHKLYPGFNPNLLLGAKDRNVKAVILDMYHSGTGCTRMGDGTGNYSISDVINKISMNGVSVLAAGSPIRSNEQYDSLAKLINSGLIPLGYISLECAVVKTMYLLGLGLSKNEFERLIEKNIVHEIYQGTL